MKKWLVLLGLCGIMGTAGGAETPTDEMDDAAFLKMLQDTLAKLGNPWVAGMPTISRELREKWIKEGTGLNITMDKTRAITPKYKESPRAKARRLKGEKLLDALDWRTYNGHNWMTTVKDQGSCGSCWAHGVASALEARMKIFNNTPDENPDLSEQFLVSCCHEQGVNGCNGITTQYGHITYGRVMQFIKDTGMPDESCFPYQAQDRPCTERCSDWETRVVKITDYGYTEPTAANYKNELRDGPMACAVEWRKDIFFYKSGVYMPIMGKYINHAVCLAGWDDAQNAWLLKNSWGNSSSYVWRGYGEEGSNYGGPSWVYWMDPPLTIPDIGLTNFQVTEPNNSIWNPGEQVNIVIYLKAEVGDFIGVQGSITSTDPNVTVNSGVSNFSNITHGNTANNSTSPFKVTASASCPIPHTVTFNISITATTPTYSDSFTLQYDIEAGWRSCRKISEFANVGNCPSAMAFDGTYFWITSLYSNQIYKVDKTGTQISTIPTPENDASCLGIVWNNGRLWVQSSGTKQIYKVNPTNGAIDTQFTSPATEFPTGITSDGSYLYAVDRDQHKIFKVSTSGNLLSSFDIPIPQPPLGAVAAQAVAFDPHGDYENGSLILYYTWLSGSASNPILDSTNIYELTMDGSFTENLCKTPGSISANGRLVCVNPQTRTYWVDGGEEGPISEIRGFNPMGVEEVTPRSLINDFTIMPNPSLHKAYINFHISKGCKISVRIYDIAGSLIYRVAEKEFQSGTHRLTWDGNDLAGKSVPSGIYFCRIEGIDVTTTKKFVIIR
ncbi:MAG: T9SS type A sorting domain-containing protein [Candidatus Stahlbacteria bacterium]|nr:T9SS type A sorting domain-containing protein [Candidatus Stahlbacteria bacterium]